LTFWETGFTDTRNWGGADYHGHDAWKEKGQHDWIYDSKAGGGEVRKGKIACWWLQTDYWGPSLKEKAPAEENGYNP